MHRFWQRHDISEYAVYAVSYVQFFFRRFYVYIRRTLVYGILQKRVNDANNR